MAKAKADGLHVEALVISLTLSDFKRFASLRINIPKDLRQKEAREFVGKAINEVSKRFPQGLPQLDPEEDMKINDGDYRKIVRRLESVELAIKKHAVTSSPTMEERLLAAQQKRRLSQKISTVNREGKEEGSVGVWLVVEMLMAMLFSCTTGLKVLFSMLCLALCHSQSGAHSRAKAGAQVVSASTTQVGIHR